MEIVVGAFAIVALFAGSFIFFQLVRLLGYLARATALGVLGVFFGFTFSVMFDIKFITLAAAFLTYAYSVEGGRWWIYGAILSFYLFALCSAHIVILMVENLRKTSWGSKLSILKPFEFNFDALSSVNKGLPDVMRMGVAFLGGLGLFFSFSFLFFIASHLTPNLFPGIKYDPLSFGESFGFALQAWLDVVPVVNTASEHQFSTLGASWSTWPSRISMFLILSYQFLIYPAAYNFIAKLWEVSHAQH